MSQRTTPCPWAQGSPEYLDYHDLEWGVPVRDEQRLFEFLALEGMQAGLSWLTVLRKREALRRAFADFDPAAVARFDARKVGALLRDAAIIRHRGKIEATVQNASVVVALRAQPQSFVDLAWSFVGGRPIQNRWRRPGQIPASTPASERMSKALKRLGFRFVGPTTCYAFMQATGMVNDHLVGCPRYLPCRELGA